MSRGGDWMSRGKAGMDRDEAGRDVGRGIAGPLLNDPDGARGADPIRQSPTVFALAHDLVRFAGSGLNFGKDRKRIP